MSPTTTTAFTMEVTPQLILITLDRSRHPVHLLRRLLDQRRRATAGMRLPEDAGRGCRHRQHAVAGRGHEAVHRHRATRSPCCRSSRHCSRSRASLQFAVALFLFFTAITNDLRQGLHDKFANSLVIRSATSGDGATVVGCLLLIGIVGVLAIVLSSLFFAAIGSGAE